MKKLLIKPLFLFLLFTMFIQILPKSYEILDMNEDFGDPASGMKKILTIKYKLNGKTETINFSENDRRSSSSPGMTGGWPVEPRIISVPDKAEIISATYGAENKQKDVIDIVKRMLS